MEPGLLNILSNGNIPATARDVKVAANMMSIAAYTMFIYIILARLSSTRRRKK